MKYAITDLTREELDLCEKALLSQLTSTGNDVIPTAPSLVPAVGDGGPVPLEQHTPALVPGDPTVTTGNEAEFDAEGYPWDERIHSSAKSKTAKGMWKKRKNVDDAVRAAVEAELKGTPASAAPAQPVAPVEQPQTTAPVVDPTTVFTPEMTAVNNELTSPAFVNPGPAAAPVEQPAAPAEAYTYADLMQSLSGAIQAGTFDQTGVAMLNTALGINNIQEISADVAKITYAIQLINNPAGLAQAAALANPAQAAG